jgi:putative endonuclease
VSFWTDPSSASVNPTPNIGQLGEQLVAQWLQAQNWVILHHRWRCRWGEIDLIAQHAEKGTGEEPKTVSTTNHSGQQSCTLTSLHPQPPSLAFVEVKTRSSGNWDADGRLSITPQKQAKLWQAAQLFLAKYPELANFPCRFDVALVSYQRVSLRSQGVSPASISEHYTHLSSSPAAIPKATQLAIQLGQPIVTAEYRLFLQEYIPSAFDGF